MTWWTFSHGLAFAIGGLVTLAVMLITGWRLDDGNRSDDRDLRPGGYRRARGEVVEGRVIRR